MLAISWSKFGIPVLAAAVCHPHNVGLHQGALTGVRKGKILAGLPLAFSVCLSLAVSSHVAAADAVPIVPAEASTGIVPTIENGRRIYSAAQFARFAPQTAADIAQQIPGFSITEVSDDRGLGEASQNVLINGQRITGKGNDAEAALRQIAVKSIRRLEIIDGATLNISGLSGDVLNVLTEQDTVQGNFALRPQIRERIKDYWTAGDASVSGKAGRGDFTLGLRVNGFRGGGWGTETELRPATNLTVLRDAERRFSNDAPRLSGSYKFKSESGSLWNTNASVEHQYFRRRSTNIYQLPNEGVTTELSRGSNKKWRTEIGSDYEFALGVGRLKLVGFYSQDMGPNSNELTRLRTDRSVPTGSRFSRESKEGERVLRSEYRWKALSGDFTLSAEGAYNFVDATGALDVFDAAGVFQPVVLDGASSRVEEKRGESILSFSRPLVEGWSLQLSGGAERSALSQGGAGGQTRRFWRPKGAVSVAWKPSKLWETNLKLQRKVGQLDFFDFLSSVDLQNDTSNGSNVSLVPPQSWLATLELSRSLGARGRIKFNVEAEDISDYVDQVPLSATLEAPGNLPKATRVQYTLTTSLLLDGLGIAGGKLDTYFQLNDSKVLDPLFGTSRQLNGNRYYWNADFRQDIPGTPWTWGLFAEKSSTNRFYRLDFLETQRNDRPFAAIFLEHKNVFGLKARIAIANLFNSHEISQQVAYVDRRNGPVAYSRNFPLIFHPILRLQLSGTF
jgi:outer membrane receptor for ferrienterochelin and colicins